MSNLREGKIQVRLTDAEKAAFSALAERDGYTSAGLMRKLIKAALKESDALPASEVSIQSHEEKKPESRDLGVTVRLKTSEKQALSTLASTLGMSHQRTFVALLRSTVANAPLVTQDEMQALLNTRGELQKIGVNLNQIARAINAERKAGTFKESSIDVESLNKLSKEAKEKIEKISKEITQMMQASRTRITLNVKNG